MRPTWAEISLTALRNNFRTIQDYVAPEAAVCCVVKADAYGHGAVECARALEQEGALWFGVSSTDEGVCLRRSEEHTSELQSRENLVCRLLLEKKKNTKNIRTTN